MKSILESLYAGQIGFDNVHYGQDIDFVKAACEELDSFEGFMETFDESTQKRFAQYCDARSEIEAITRYNTFTSALQFGVLLMAELFPRQGSKS